MRIGPRVRAGVLVAAFGAGAASAGLPAPERVRFASLDTVRGQLVMIDALLFRPGQTPAAAVPAVIALHGCGGLYSAARGREAMLSDRHAAHAEALLAAGYAVLFPDSLGSRGLREVCTIRAAERPLNAPRRRLDALGALQWLAAQTGIAHDRIALIGWSQGGTTALATVNAAHRDVAAFRARADAVPFFRGAVAFYPGCTAAARDAKWHPAVPTRIFIGAEDDWTPAAACKELAATAKRDRWPLETIVYPGAHHGFDAPRGRLVHRADVPGGVVPGRGVHIGPDPGARADANRRMAAFLRELLAP